MKIKITCRPRYNPWLKKYLNTKTFSKMLALGVLVNSVPINSFAGILSEDGRYETFKGKEITINDVLEEDKTEVEIEGDTAINLLDIERIRGDKSSLVESIDLNTHSFEVTYFDDFTNNYVENRAVIYSDFIKKIKPDQKYTFIYDYELLENPYNEPAQIGIAIDFWRDNIANSNKVVNVGSSGTTIKTVSTNSLINGYSSTINFYNVIGRNTKWKISNFRIYEGEAKNIPNKFHKNIQSSFEEQLVTQEMINSGEEKIENLDKYKVEVKSTGKNKFDINKVIPKNSYTIYNRENSNSFSFYRTKNSPIQAKISLGIYKKGTYTMSFQLDKENNGTNFIVRKANTDYRDYLLQIFSASENSFTFSLDEDTELLFETDGYLTVMTVNNLQIEEGVIATEYEPHKESINTLYLNSPLLEGDTIEYVNGQVNHVHRYGKIVLNGSEDWVEVANKNEFYGYDLDYSLLYLSDTYIEKINMKHSSFNQDAIYSYSDKFKSLSRNDGWNIKHQGEYIHNECISIKNSRLNSLSLNGFKQWLKDNPVTVVYELDTPTYEPIKADLSANLFEETTHISANSNVSTNLKVTVDRVANRAKEYSELAKVNPTIENISLARMWTNKMRESILKDEFQDNIDTITEITDMTLERKTASANLDVYIKSENMLSMNLSTNSITFDDFSGVEDMTKENAVNISINSSLPYNLNAYLVTEIQNSDKSNTMNKDILSIKDNSELDYQTFSSINNKIVLKSNCNSGNDKQHNIDLKLNGGIAHEKDVYKTTIKFEAEQQ